MPRSGRRRGTFSPKGPSIVSRPFAADADRSSRTRVLAGDLIAAAYQQVIPRAHAHGLNAFGATLTPCNGSEFFSAQGKQARQQVNAWIRNSNAFDAVLDFEAAWIDSRTNRVTNGSHWGDFLHGSDAGYHALANAVDLTTMC